MPATPSPRSMNRILHDFWCRSVILSVSSPNEPKSRVFPPNVTQTVLSLAVSRHWLVHQLDVKNAFLHGDLSETRMYASELLEQAHMARCNACWTLVDKKYKLGVDGDPCV
ncbi:ribonuclease H-like domain-containing protein [Tanacetum coccineum]